CEIACWLRLFLFVVLFGLSMDYHVFILTRVREAVDRGLGTERAVSQAVSSTAGTGTSAAGRGGGWVARGVGRAGGVWQAVSSSAGTVTSAAVVMVGVFAVFATLSQI